MAEQKKWKEVAPNTDVHNFDEDPILEGKYVDKEHDVGINKSNIYHIKPAGGEVEKIWGCVTLNARMERVELDSEVRIELKKKVPNKYGKETKIFKVSILDGVALREPQQKEQVNETILVKE